MEYSGMKSPFEQHEHERVSRDRRRYSSKLPFYLLSGYLFLGPVLLICLKRASTISITVFICYSVTVGIVLFSRLVIVLASNGKTTRRAERVVGSVNSGRILSGNSVRLNHEGTTDRLAANTGSEGKDDQHADTTRHSGPAQGRPRT